MARKQTVQHVLLDHNPFEILSYNPKRISATIIADTENGNGFLALGNSGQHARSGLWVVLSDYTILWQGVNPLWAVVPEQAAVPQPFTILVLIEE